MSGTDFPGYETPPNSWRTNNLIIFKNKALDRNLTIIYGILTVPWFSYNPFSTNVPLLHPLKTSENPRFSDVFRGYRSGTLIENGLIVNVAI